MTDHDPAIGDRVVTLRSEGRSFASIAKTVGVERATDAFTLFVDTIGARPSHERTRLAAEENHRLDVLERRTARITDDRERARRQTALCRLRSRLAASQATHHQNRRHPPGADDTTT